MAKIKKQIIIDTAYHPEIKKLTMAWCNKMPYMAIWDKMKLADDITKCFRLIAKQNGVEFLNLDK